MSIFLPSWIQKLSFIETFPIFIHLANFGFYCVLLAAKFASGEGGSSKIAQKLMLLKHENTKKINKLASLWLGFSCSLFMAPHGCRETSLIYKTVVFLINSTREWLCMIWSISETSKINFAERALRRSTCVYCLIQMMMINTDKSIVNSNGRGDVKRMIRGVVKAELNKNMFLMWHKNSNDKFSTLNKHFEKATHKNSCAIGKWVFGRRGSKQSQNLSRSLSRITS